MKQIINKLIIMFVALASLAISTNAICKTSDDNSNAVSEVAIDALAQNDLTNASIALLYAPQNDKSRFIMRETTRIIRFDMMDKKPPRSIAHSIYKNVAISYHNLYLFLLSNNIVNENFFKKAIKYYKKARRRGTSLHKATCDILTASIIASSGNIKKAEKRFSKIDQELLRWDYSSAEYLAAYHASVKNVDEAIKQLNIAYQISPERTRTWLLITDDFNNIKEDPRFIAFKTNLTNSKKEIKAPALTLPKSKPLKLTPLDSSDHLTVETLETPKPLKRRRRR